MRIATRSRALKSLSQPSGRPQAARSPAAYHVPMRMRSLLLFALVALLSLSPRPAAAVIGPCGIVARDPAAGVVATLMLAELLAKRLEGGGGPIGSETKQKTRALLSSTLQSSKELAASVQALSGWGDAESIAALAKLEKDLASFRAELKAKKTTEGLGAAIAGFRKRARDAVGPHSSHLEAKSLTAVLGLAIVNGIVAPDETPEPQQVLPTEWLLGDGGVASKAAKAAAKLAKAKPAADDLAKAASDYYNQGKQGGTPPFDPVANAHKALVHALVDP
jgi:hypothetical protein